MPLDGYKYCFVPKCKATTVNAPDKLFVPVPYKRDLRSKWFTAARRKLYLCDTTRFYCCQDHFQTEDFSNLVKQQLTGCRLVVRAGAVPSLFACQRDRWQLETLTTRAAYQLRRRRAPADALRNGETSPPHGRATQLTALGEPKPAPEPVAERHRQAMADALMRESEQPTEDYANKVKHDLTGCPLTVKKDAVPTLFDCQPDRKRSHTTTGRPTTVARQQKALVESILQADYKQEAEQKALVESILKNSKDVMSQVEPCMGRFEEVTVAEEEHFTEVKQEVDDADIQQALESCGSNVLIKEEVDIKQEDCGVTVLTSYAVTHDDCQPEGLTQVSGEADYLPVKTEPDSRSETNHLCPRNTATGSEIDPLFMGKEELCVEQKPQLARQHAFDSDCRGNMNESAPDGFCQKPEAGDFLGDVPCADAQCGLPPNFALTVEQEICSRDGLLCPAIARNQQMELQQAQAELAVPFPPLLLNVSGGHAPSLAWTGGAPFAVGDGAVIPPALNLGGLLLVSSGADEQPLISSGAGWQPMMCDSGFPGFGGGGADQQLGIAPQIAAGEVPMLVGPLGGQAAPDVMLGLAYKNGAAGEAPQPAAVNVPLELLYGNGPERRASEMVAEEGFYLMEVAEEEPTAAEPSSAPALLTLPEFPLKLPAVTTPPAALKRFTAATAPPATDCEETGETPLAVLCCEDLEPNQDAEERREGSRPPTPQPQPSQARLPMPCCFIKIEEGEDGLPLHRPHACSECGRRLLTRSGLRCHMLRHLLPCSLCGRLYGLARDLPRHLREHHGCGAGASLLAAPPCPLMKVQFPEHSPLRKRRPRKVPVMSNR